MAFNFVRAGGGLVLGVASGILNPLGPVGPGPFNIGAANVGWDGIAELTGTVLGAGLQMLSPMTLPNLADGLVDGGLALLGRRTSEFITNTLKGPAPTSFYQNGYARMGAARYGQVHSPTAGSMGRPVQSSFTGLPTERVG